MALVSRGGSENIRSVEDTGKWVTTPTFDHHLFYTQFAVDGGPQDGRFQTFLQSDPELSVALSRCSSQRFTEARNQRLVMLREKFKQQKEEFEREKAEQLEAIEKELQEMGYKTDVNSLQDLFKEMNLGPPYVPVKKQYIPRRKRHLHARILAYEQEMLGKTDPTALQ